MNVLPFTNDNTDVFTSIVSAIETQGYFIGFNTLEAITTDALFIHFKSLAPSVFKTAAIGRELNQTVNRFVRSDSIFWLDRNELSIAAYWQWIEQLRLTLNRSLFLGLFDYECHYAYYDKKAFYKKHYDAFKGESNRVITVIHYLNPNWQIEHGGELLLYAEEGETLLETITPEYGKTVIFLSEQFPHEVLPTHRERYSLTGWFRINDNLQTLSVPQIG